MTLYFLNLNTEALDSWFIADTVTQFPRCYYKYFMDMTISSPLSWIPIFQLVCFDKITTYLYILQSGKHSCFLLHQLCSHQSINFIYHPFIRFNLPITPLLLEPCFLTYRRNMKASVWYKFKILFFHLSIWPCNTHKSSKWILFSISDIFIFSVFDNRCNWVHNHGWCFQWWELLNKYSPLFNFHCSSEKSKMCYKS